MLAPMPRMRPGAGEDPRRTDSALSEVRRLRNPIAAPPRDERTESHERRFDYVIHFGPAFT